MGRFREILLGVSQGIFSEALKRIPFRGEQVKKLSCSLMYKKGFCNNNKKLCRARAAEVAGFGN